ncbi:hypothetical protein E2C01_032545 [Portunus trituberculatus]|uniref:Uncharacterized protein n=1 Tax=Portunus trituberculatus TaxID=210409 RepID=A0A5B7F103_PORTR|nr:hypothetical protein [Portunus trituberculatus]
MLKGEAGVQTRYNHVNKGRVSAMAFTFIHKNTLRLCVSKLRDPCWSLEIESRYQLLIMKCLAVICEHEVNKALVWCVAVRSQHSSLN